MNENQMVFGKTQPIERLRKKDTKQNKVNEDRAHAVFTIDFQLCIDCKKRSYPEIIRISDLFMTICQKCKDDICEIVNNSTKTACVHAKLI